MKKGGTTTSSSFMDDCRVFLFYGSIAQLVEQRTENPCVVGSIPTGATIYYLKYECFC